MVCYKTVKNVMGEGGEGEVSGTDSVSAESDPDLERLLDGCL